jgi:hypothetical protein
LLEFQHFGRFVDIFFGALIASGLERRIDRRSRSDCVGLGKRDSVPEIQILPKVKPMILAENHPKVRAVFPHTSSLRAVTRVGRDFSGLMISNRAERFLEKR